MSEKQEPRKQVKRSEAENEKRRVMREAAAKHRESLTDRAVPATYEAMEDMLKVIEPSELLRQIVGSLLEAIRSYEKAVPQNSLSQEEQFQVITIHTVLEGCLSNLMMEAVEVNDLGGLLGQFVSQLADALGDRVKEGGDDDEPRAA